LGKTIVAGLLLREYLLRGLACRVLVLVPTPLVSQWHEELLSKFHLDFSIPPRTRQADRAESWACASVCRALAGEPDGPSHPEGTRPMAFKGVSQGLAAEGLGSRTRPTTAIVIHAGLDV
jgi:hypothetical protein